MTARFCTGLAAGAVALLAMQGAFAQAVDGPKVDWKVATWGKPRAFTAGMETLAKHVSDRTGGKFTITIGYESFGGAKDNGKGKNNIGTDGNGEVARGSKATPNWNLPSSKAITRSASSLRAVSSAGSPRCRWLKR